MSLHVVLVLVLCAVLWRDARHSVFMEGCWLPAWWDRAASAVTFSQGFNRVVMGSSLRIFGLLRTRNDEQQIKL